MYTHKSLAKRVSIGVWIALLLEATICIKNIFDPLSKTKIL
jgi:hypothetical protein